MYHKVKVAISNRHVHLTEETYNKLFDFPLTKRNDLNQIGQFAANETVDIISGDRVIENVRIVGPFRTYNQIEISLDECKILGVNPPARQSGDLDNTFPINIIGPCGKVSLDSGLIKAERHIHLTKESLEKEGLNNKEKVAVFHNGRYLFDAIIKLSIPGYDELHIDTVEEKEYDLHNNDIVEFKKYIR